MAPSTEAPLAVLDTNIIIDIFSIGDLLAASQKSAHGQNIDHSSSDLLFRRIRARESLLLAWFFHTKGARTETYGREAVEILSRHVPPQLDPEESSESRFKRNYATVSIWFLKDYILPRWNLTIDRSEPELRGNAADDHLVRLATTYRRPLISNEGFSLTGIDDNHGLRKKVSVRPIAVG
ncbi:MAG: hypothetical protein MUC96_37030 [Myxococcaceae bacterium]|jgi:hypothetical protein|nr:hypothetical protein [Myxococcaceae bacterium]